jgi:Holliday junction DNA helicase RuvB
MEDGRVDIVVGSGPEAHTLALDLPPFTLAAATTRSGQLNDPLRARFGAIFDLELYPVSDLVRILQRAADGMGALCSEQGLTTLAQHAKGTPRVALMLLLRALDYATNEGTSLGETQARMTLRLWGVSKDGLERADRALLRALRRAGRPVGRQTLAALTGEEEDVLVYTREPYLMRLGLVERTPQGRTLSSAGMMYCERYCQQAEAGQ